MRRLIRGLFALAMAASTVLCIGVCVLWVRSYWVGDGVYRLGDESQAGLVAGRGVIWVYHTASTARGGADQIKWRYRAARPPSDLAAERKAIQESVHHRGSWLGCTAARLRAGGVEHDSLFLPCWLPAALAAVAPAAAAWRWCRRRRARRRGLCTVCGYDLRATPGRCPECGIVPANGMGAA